MMDAYNDTKKVRPFGIYIARHEGDGPWKQDANEATVKHFFTAGHNVVLAHLSLDCGDVRPGSVLHHVYCITLHRAHWTSQLPALPCYANMTKTP